MILLAAGLLLAAQDVDAPRVVFRTSMGDIVVALDRAAAPRTSEQILSLVRAGVYDGIPLTRIVPGVLVQIDHHRTRRLPLTAAQTGLVRKLPVERSALRHLRGSVALAHPDDEPDGGETSFSLFLADAPHLDGRYTVFGRVERGLDVAEAVARLKDPGSERPSVHVEVERAFEMRPGMELRNALAFPAFDAQKGAARLLLIAGLAALAAGVALAAWANRTSRPGLRSAGLMAALAGFFLVFGGALQHFETGRRPAAATALLFAAFLVFRWMSAFERPRDQRAG